MEEKEVGQAMTGSRQRGLQLTERDWSGRVWAAARGSRSGRGTCRGVSVRFGIGWVGDGGRRCTRDGQAAGDGCFTWNSEILFFCAGKVNGILV